MGLALYRDKTLSVALPEIGQNLHELDGLFLPFFFQYIPLGAERASHRKHIIQSHADGLSCALPWGPHFGWALVIPKLETSEDPSLDSAALLGRFT